MRPILLAIVYSAALVPVAARAENGVCEYRHPAHPNWDFFASCSWSETTTETATRREVTVSNGSQFTTVTGAEQDSVNGLPARRLDRDDAACWRTVAEDELICVYPEGTIRPADPGSSADAFDAAPATVSQGTFGGGTQEFCLLVEAGTLVEQGICVKRENCLELEAGAGMSCLASYDWASGRVSEMASAEDWVTFDGAPVIKGDPGCVVDVKAAVTFCHSAEAMTLATHPILAPAGQKEGAPAEASAPEGEGASPTVGAE